MLLQSERNSVKKETLSDCVEIAKQPCRYRWTYEQAFSRNRGLIDVDEQARIRNCRVAIVGLGGVGGSHLVTLARLGIGKFKIADPDVFECVNSNRQYGASLKALGQAKVDVMDEIARNINPEIEITSFNGRVDASNTEQFLDGCDILVDGIDLYGIEARRQIFKAAEAKGIPAVTAGPMGFSTCWLVFDSSSMSFDRYFDLYDDMPQGDKVISFLMGLCPRMLPLKYMDRKQANPVSGQAPSVSAGCQLATGVVATEVVKLLLGKGVVKKAPYYHIFDAYLGRMVCGRLPLGNRGPWQRIKREWLKRDWKQRFPELGF